VAKEGKRTDGGEMVERLEALLPLLANIYTTRLSEPKYLFMHL
jgi:hypothetical protein